MYLKLWKCGNLGQIILLDVHGTSFQRKRLNESNCSLWTIFRNAPRYTYEYIWNVEYKIKKIFQHYKKQTKKKKKKKKHDWKEENRVERLKPTSCIALAWNDRNFDPIEIHGHTLENEGWRRIPAIRAALITRQLIGNTSRMLSSERGYRLPRTSGTCWQPSIFPSKTLRDAFVRLRETGCVITGGANLSASRCRWYRYVPCTRSSSGQKLAVSIVVDKFSGIPGYWFGNVRRTA